MTTYTDDSPTRTARPPLDETPAGSKESFSPPGDPAPRDVTVTFHARERWEQRIDAEVSAPELEIREAFCEGLRVGHPHAAGARARLYPPENVLMLFRGVEDTPIVVTAYEATQALSEGLLNIEHLTVCKQCEQLTDPQRGPVDGSVCSWCDAELVDAVPAAHLSADDLADYPETILPERPMCNRISERDCPYCDWSGPNNKFGEHLAECPSVDHSTGEVVATDGGYQIQPTDQVVDREDEKSYPSHAVVLETTSTPAEDYPIDELDGETVAELNPEYPADSPVVLVVFARDLDSTLPDWEDCSATHLRKHIQQHGHDVYAYPEARLNFAARGNRFEPPADRSEANL